MGCGPRTPASEAPARTSASRLLQESSPYLRQHADNLVDWYPWGDEALAKAQAEGKPIFLSVGYSTCHWCHVMEEESFMNPEIARRLNENFVAIKVDRETRPDIDRLYMQFLVDTTGSGGWPMSVFLTPQGQPFLAGTYYPQPARAGLIGFGELLDQVAQAWTDHPGSFQAEAADIAQRMAQAARRPAHSTKPSTGLIEGAVADFRDRFDRENGGFGSAPKFPQAPLLGFLLDYGYQHPASGAEKMALETLKAMADSGLHDRLGGGFHRYATDARWQVPHFEKMLSDQAQLLSLYSRAYALTGEVVYREAAESILGYLEARLRLPDGGYASAEDADSALPDSPDQHAEGAYYLWTEAEIDAVCGDQAAALKKAFGISRAGNAGEELAGRNLLGRGSGKGLEAALARLAQAQEKRPRPARDDKILSGWNAMLAGALAEASSALKRPELAQRSEALLKGLEKDLVVQGRLQRSRFKGRSEIDGFAQDHAELVAAYLRLYAAEGRPSALLRAVHWQAEQERLFADAEHGGYFETAVGHGLLFRDKEMQDGALPCTASRSAQNLLTLHRLTGQDGYRKTYERLLQSLGEEFLKAPRALPGVLQAMDLEHGREQSVVLVGEEPGWREILQAGYHPERLQHWLRSPEDQRALASTVPFLASLPPDTAVYFCQDFACGLPLTSSEALRARLKR